MVDSGGNSPGFNLNSAELKNALARLSGKRVRNCTPPAPDSFPYINLFLSVFLVLLISNAAMAKSALPL